MFKDRPDDLTAKDAKNAKKISDSVGAIPPCLPSRHNRSQSHTCSPHAIRNPGNYRQYNPNVGAYGIRPEGRCGGVLTKTMGIGAKRLHPSYSDPIAPLKS
jgi:hypothetical protein